MSEIELKKCVLVEDDNDNNIAIYTVDEFTGMEEDIIEAVVDNLSAYSKGVLLDNTYDSVEYGRKSYSPSEIADAMGDTDELVRGVLMQYSDLSEPPDDGGTIHAEGYRYRAVWLDESEEYDWYIQVDGEVGAERKKVKLCMRDSGDVLRDVDVFRRGDTLFMTDEPPKAPEKVLEANTADGVLVVRFDREGYNDGLYELIREPGVVRGRIVNTTEGMDGITGMVGRGHERVRIYDDNGKVADVKVDGLQPIWVGTTADGGFVIALE